jgi:hypothetical protein
MYLLYLDESGTHAGSPALVLAGLAVHEQDAWHLQQAIDTMLARSLPQGLDPAEFELHATDLKSPVKKGGGRSNWAQVSYGSRLNIMSQTFRVLASFKETDSKFPFALFGAVVDRSYADREKRSYEEVLNKFDEMLNRQGMPHGRHERGMVIHDRHLLERDVQVWTAAWRHVAGRIGKLTHFTDVPMFADSRASRLIQAADFVAWGLYRYYGDAKDDRWMRPVWNRFDNAGGQMHGLIHVSPGFKNGMCTCPPCSSRRPSPPALFSPPSAGGTP